MLGAGGHDVDASRIDAAVTEKIGEFGDILLQPVEGAGEEMPEVVRKDLGAVDPRLFAQLFHITPNADAA